MEVEEAPEISEDLIAEITKAAVETAVKKMTELLQPLVRKVTQLEQTQHRPLTDLPGRKGLIVTEKGGEEKGETEVPWYERLGIE